MSKRYSQPVSSGAIDEVTELLKIGASTVEELATTMQCTKIHVKRVINNLKDKSKIHIVSYKKVNSRQYEVYALGNLDDAEKVLEWGAKAKEPKIEKPLVPCALHEIFFSQKENGKIYLRDIDHAFYFGYADL